MKKITIATDSFKGSLTSLEVAEAFSAGFRSVYEGCIVQKVTIADGGEGTIDALVHTLGGRYIETEVADPLMRPIKARYGLIEDSHTAIIEMSAASGLPLLTKSEQNPLKTTTYGTGELIADALRRGAQHLIIGIGGSATNDAGVGMLRALGFRFLDTAGNELSGGGEILEKIASIDERSAMPELKKAEIKVACDVTNPLYGKMGAAYIFAPQKGANEAMVEILDNGLRHFAERVKAHNGIDIATMPGAGAAGGLGGGITALLGAQLERGVDLILKAIDFDSLIEGSDLVVTGEGRIDSQTIMGKAPSGVLHAAQAHGIPTIAIGGAVVDCDELQQSDFTAIIPITDTPLPLNIAMQPDVATANVYNTAVKIAQLIKNRELLSK